MKIRNTIAKKQDSLLHKNRLEATQQQRLSPACLLFISQPCVGCPITAAWAHHYRIAKTSLPHSKNKVPTQG